MKGIEIFIWCNTFFAIIGTILNAKKVRFGFVIWMITNAVFVANNIYIESYQQAVLFSVYFGLSLFGWISWGKEKLQKPKVETTETVS